MVEVSNYLVYAPTYYPKCDPLVVRILKNYAEENEVGRYHIHDEVTFQALNSESMVRNLNESRKFEQLENTLNWAVFTCKDVFVKLEVNPEFTQHIHQDEHCGEKGHRVVQEEVKGDHFVVDISLFSCSCFGGTRLFHLARFVTLSSHLSRC